MLLLSIPQFRRHHKRARSKTAAPPPPPLAVRSVQVVEFAYPTGSLIVGFNTTAQAPLADLSGADPAKWTVQFADVFYRGSSIVAEGPTQARLIVAAESAGPGADAVSYANDPSDIADVLGRQLAAFDGFPISG